MPYARKWENSQFLFFRTYWW